MGENLTVSLKKQNPVHFFRATIRKPTYEELLAIISIIVINTISRVSEVKNENNMEHFLLHV